MNASSAAIPSLSFLFLVALSAPAQAAEEPVSFRKSIAPLLLNHCQACHGPKKAEGGYRVDSFERAAAAGDSGLVPFKAGKLDDSELLRRIASDDADERMPLDGDPLPKEQVALVEQWIRQGAKYDADDPAAAIVSIIPAAEHPPAPEAYAHTLPITALAFSTDGKELFAGGYHEVSVWNPADGQLVRRIGNQGERTYAIRFSPDGKLLATASGTPGRLGELRLFDPATGDLVRVLGSTGDVVFDAAFSPDGKRIALASADSTIHVYDVATGKQQLLLASHSDWVGAIAWNADGSRLASASRDKTAKVFDAKTGDLIITYSEHGEPVRGVAFHPDGKEVYSSAADKKVQLWKIEDGKKSADVSTFGGEVHKLLTADTFLFAGSDDKKLRQWTLADRKQVREYAGAGDWILSVAYNPTVKRVAAGCFNGEIRVWSTEDGAETTTFLAAPGYAK